MSREIFESLTQHITITEEHKQRLMLYHDLLIKWQSRINLVGPDTITDLWKRHFLDSLQLVPHLQDVSHGTIDFGTGAGFPGMVLAICGVNDIHLAESDAKKISFLHEVARITETSVSIHHTRIEDLPSRKFSVILSRALTNLDSLLHYSFPFVSHETFCLFPKGKNYATELEDAKKNWNFHFNLIPSVTDDQGVIIKLFDLEKRHHGHLNRT